MNKDKIAVAAMDWHDLVGITPTRASMAAFVAGAELGHNHDCWQTYADNTEEELQELEELKAKFAKEEEDGL